MKIIYPIFYIMTSSNRISNLILGEDATLANKNIIIQHKNGVDLLNRETYLSHSKFENADISHLFVPTPDLEMDEKKVNYKKVDKPTSKMVKKVKRNIKIQENINDLYQTDYIVQFYFASLTIIGLYAVFRFMKANDIGR